MHPYTLYIVDDEQSIRDALSYGLRKLYRVLSFATAEEAIEQLDREVPDLVLLDIRLPGMNGVEALREIRQRNPEIMVIMVTGIEEVDTVIEAMKSGAYDYVVKPIHLDTLRVTVANALEKIKLRKEIQQLQEERLREQVPCFIGDSNVIQDVMHFVEKIAKSPDTPVLIVGETGTGKELISSAIHYKSPNFNGPFVSINCASIPRDLIESELFGYEKGAFSGAAASGKRGLVEEAEGGTLFLDEVGDLSLPAQAKLLRFLEEGEYYRVGGTQKLATRTRIVSATNKNLEEMVDQDQFRRDLFYRLAVIKVAVPSLNDRRDDIIPLARHYLLEFSGKYGKHLEGFDPAAAEFLQHHVWKGNIRELRNLMERGALISNGPLVSLADLGVEPAAAPGAAAATGTPEALFPDLPDGGLDLERLEEHLIRAAYRMAGGNETRAARLLNISYYAFRYKRKKIKDLK